MPTETRPAKPSLAAANAVRFRAAAGKQAAAMAARLHLLDDETLEMLFRATLAELDERIEGYIAEWRGQQPDSE